MLGMDTISAGNLMGFIMECSEKGIWPGEKIAFGDYEKALELLEKIAYREGCAADLAAEGVRSLAERLGAESSDYAMQVKGLEMPSYNPLVGYGTALSYALSPRGACHRRAWPPVVEVLGGQERYVTENKAAVVKNMSDENDILHSLLVCDFPAKWIPLKTPEYAEYMTLATGEAWTAEDLETAAERIEAQIRLYNNREGLSRADDWLPERVLKKIPPEHLEQMISEYYAMRGWDEKGVPKPDLLAKLGI
jgi:aldehyde:ferredoxin oxidoreductase